MDPAPDDVAADNGLLHRRTLLKGALGASLLAALPASAGERPPSTTTPGRPMRRYGTPSEHEGHVQRVGIASQPGTPGSGASRTPLERLDGTITPSGLHFERHHNGVPDIDPDQHRLYVHGLVKRALEFSVADLIRYPLVSRLYFLECSGNSGNLIADDPVPETCGEIHGLISCSEWTGVPVSVLLDEAGVEPDGRWVVAEGADAAMMNRSIPITKMYDDALLALYQNGERLRPENGYPLRLFLPGWEGNTSVKWLRRLTVTRQPAMSRQETARYTDLQSDGTAVRFSFPMSVKSVITSPAPGLELKTAGVYQISGIAWSGEGRIRRVEVSADGGSTWAVATLDEPVLAKCPVRFRLPWRWQRQPAVLMSRATDTTGAVQLSRTAVMAGRRGFYHYNAIQAWRVDPEGHIANTYV